MKLLVFSQDLENCIWCKRYQPALDEIISEGYDVEIVKAFDPDGTQNPLNAEYEVRSTPTSFVLNEDGSIKERFEGVKSPTAIKKLLED